MKIAITPRFFENNIEKIIGIEKKYYPFFNKFGYSINLIPYTGIEIKRFYDEIKPDLIVFAGGYRLYTEEIKNFEINVLNESLERNLPILGICCGMWTINYFFNGTLKFDESHQAFDGNKINITKMTHFVEATDLIKKKFYTVNSFHSKIINNIGAGLKTFLISKNGSVEGFYNLEKKIIGIQFHMENEGVTTDLTNQIMQKVKAL